MTLLIDEHSLLLGREDRNPLLMAGLFTEKISYIDFITNK